MKCLHCQTELITKHQIKFCNRSCAASFNNAKRGPKSIETKQKIRKTVTNLIKNGQWHGVPPSRLISSYPYTRIYKLISCSNCSNNFWQTKPYQKCCSKSCRDSICSQNKVKKTQIVYFNKYDQVNITLQSTWELIIAEWLDANNVAWQRPVNRIKWIDTTLNKTRTYLPDFWLVSYSVYLDVKNPVKQSEDADKLSQLKSIIPLYVGDIDYIKQAVERLAGLEPACVH